MYFANPAGFWALLGILALIIIYLIRPKPRDMIIPSLMFFITDKGIARKKSFLERLLRNLVFLLQLIAITCLAFAITQPSMKTGYDTTAENTVIVLDVSASMQADERFEQAIDVAEKSLKGDISIILAEETPLVVLERGSGSKAKGILDQLKPKDTTTNIGDAMLLSKDILDGAEGRVLVISDFIQTHGPDPNVVRKILEADKAIVDLVDVRSQPKKGNAGIVDMTVEKHNTVLYIKNYGEEEKAVTVRVVNDDKEVKKVSKTFLARSVDTISFETPPGVTEAEILDKDDLDADNKVYISAPDKIELDVLLITNSVNTYLKYALESSKDIRLAVAEPPVIPPISDFDVIIFSNVDETKLLTGTLEEMKKSVHGGKHFIITAQDSLMQFDFLDMMPVFLLEKKEKESIKIRPYAETNDQKYGFAEDESMDYGTALKYFTATAKNGSVVYAEGGESPIIASIKLGTGNIVYYGIFDESGSFKSSPSYPVFWNDLINTMMGTDDISKFNFKTGKVISAGEVTTVRTPAGVLKTRTLVMDMSGIYDVGDLKIAANLLDDGESDIYMETGIESVKHDSYKAGKIEREKDTGLEIYLLLIVLAAVIAEIAYVKYRGDI